MWKVRFAAFLFCLKACLNNSIRTVYGQYYLDVYYDIHFYNVTLTDEDLHYILNHNVVIKYIIVAYHYQFQVMFRLNPVLRDEQYQFCYAEQ